MYVYRIVIIKGDCIVKNALCLYQSVLLLSHNQSVIKIVGN